MFDDYICEKIMCYASGDIEDLNRIKQQMTMEAITQGTVFTNTLILAVFAQVFGTS